MGVAPPIEPPGIEPALVAPETSRSLTFRTFSAVFLAVLVFGPRPNRQALRRESRELGVGGREHD